MIEGSIRDGVTRLDVEFETLGQLLARTGRRSDVERLPRLQRLRDPERDFEDLAAVLSDLYAVRDRSAASRVGAPAVDRHG
jgi:hypothetical protein